MAVADDREDGPVPVLQDSGDDERRDRDHDTVDPRLEAGGVREEHLHGPDRAAALRSLRLCVR